VANASPSWQNLRSRNLNVGEMQKKVVQHRLAHI
jgi:hypothetical protein